jgi:ABC-type Na+ efflux pump permease subunit
MNNPISMLIVLWALLAIAIVSFVIATLETTLSMFGDAHDVGDAASRTAVSVGAAATIFGVLELLRHPLTALWGLRVLSGIAVLSGVYSLFRLGKEKKLEADRPTVVLVLSTACGCVVCRVWLVDAACLAEGGETG